MTQVLIIDDNEGVCSALEILLSLNDISSVSVNSPEAGLEALEQLDIGLVIQDMRFTEDTTSGHEGEKLFAQIRSQHPDLPVILLTAWTHLESAVQLVKQGAADYQAKPWDDDKLISTVRNLLKLNQLQTNLQDKFEEELHARQELAEADLCGTVFESNTMTQVIQLAVQVAGSDLPVLITGPNGSGKEKIAEIIHSNSRRKGEMVSTNAGAMPGDLIESELFGSVEGAFTGAKTREGRFSKAHNGTLFLDEIGNLPLEGQMKLLRVLQTGEFERLGSTDTQTVDVRLVCATNADINADIKAGEFRQDLYYRINVIEIQVPPLNRRPADILPLANHFLSKGNSLSEKAAQALVAYHWPGNVRELENCMKRAEVLSQSGVIEVSDLGLNLEIRQSDFTSGADAITAEDVQRALHNYNGVVSRAAKSLGLSRQAFYRRMEAYGLKD